MKRIKFLSICMVLFTMFIFSGCDHDTDTFDGPSLIDQFGPFVVNTDFSASQSTVDFANGETVFFNAEFNINVNWVVEITGSESGSIKRIEGFSNVLDASNATWNGGTTVLPLFTEEEVTAVLTIPDMPGFFANTTIETLSKRSFEGTLFTDFEEEFGIDAFVGNFEFEFTSDTGRDPSFPAEGDFSFRFEGTDNVVPNFFVGLVDFKSTITGNTLLQLPTTVPEDLFFNTFIFSEGGPHGIGIIQFAVDSNDSGAFEDNIDQTFQVTPDIDLAIFEGWKQISYPMSDTGISQADLANIVNIRVLLISDMNAQPSPPLQVGFGLDFMIFTEGGPLDLE